MIINPNNIQNVVKFNLLDNDVVGKYVGCVDETATFMTSKGDVVGPFKTCYVDKDCPLMKLTIEAKGENLNLSTHLLVQGGNGYSFWFFAGGRWRVCSNAESEALIKVTIQGAEKVNFVSSYGKLFPTKTGPGAILKALQALQSEHESAWKQPLMVLVFSFLEAARFGKIMELVKKSLEEAAGTDNFLYLQDEVTDLTYKLTDNWGKLSKAFRDLFTPERNHPPKWYLPVSTIVGLKLERVPEGKENDVEIVRRVYLKQISQCIKLIHLLTPKGVKV